MVGFKTKANGSTAVKAPAKAKAEKPETTNEPKVLPATPGTVEPAKPVDGTVTVPTIDGDALAEHARKLGAEESEEMQSAFETAAKGRDDWQGGPIMCRLALLRNYTAEQLAEFAIPDSETGNNPDKFTVEYMDGDTKRKKKSNFYKEFAHGTVTGRSILERLEFLKRAADKGSIKDGIPEDILEMSPEARVSHTSFLEGRLSTMATAYRKAMRLHNKLSEVEEYAPECSAYVMFVDGCEPEDGETERELSEVQIERTNEPIAVTWFQGEGKPVKWEPFSIGAFLKLNPKKAAEKGGGFRHLIESGATVKAPKAPGKPDKEDGLVIKTVEKALGVLAEFHRYADEISGAKDLAEYGKLIQALKGKDMDESISALVETRNFLNDLCKKVDADRKYVTMQQGGDVPETGKAAA